MTHKIGNFEHGFIPHEDKPSKTNFGVAQEIVLAWSSGKSIQLKQVGPSLVDLIATALDAQDIKAREEAAKICDDAVILRSPVGVPPHYQYTMTPRELAKAIRASAKRGGEWMRPLKFRMWSAGNKRMLEVTRIEWLNIPEIPVMQFTGLLDKNGKEIFEGDIVVNAYNSDTKKVRFVVEMKNGAWTLCGWKELPLFGGNKDFWEVLGNIYENGR